MQSVSKFITAPIALVVETLSRPIDFAAMYANENPVELEIGSGKGTFLTDQAEQRPETNFLGIEWANWFCSCAADRLRRHNCLNARMVRAEARPMQ